MPEGSVGRIRGGVLGGRTLQTHTHSNSSVNHTHCHRSMDNSSPKSDKDNTFCAVKSYSGLLKTHRHLTRTHILRDFFSFSMRVFKFNLQADKKESKAVSWHLPLKWVYDECVPPSLSVPLRLSLSATDRKCRSVCPSSL